MRYVLLAAALLLFPTQDDEIDQWIEQLGDSDLTAREEAIENLLTIRTGMQSQRQVGMEPAPAIPAHA